MILRLDIQEDPYNLDPQMADDTASYMVLQNVMEGLLRQNDQNEIVLGVAKEYSVSSDGLTYTFTLREDAKWYHNNLEQAPFALTAHDFVFAFQRMFESPSNYPSIGEFTCLQNAQAILNGQAEVSSLGVRALNDTTLQFTLETANPFFEQLLCLPCAYPCNEEFFLSTKGRYGLDQKSLLYNGPFYLGSWTQDSVLRLYPNPSYSGEANAQLTNINFYVYEEESERISRFERGTTDILFDFESTPQQLFSARNTQSVGYYDTTWCLLYNQSLPLLQNVEIRRGLTLSLEREDILTALQEQEQGRYLAAQGLVPPSVLLGQTPYRQAASLTLIPYEPVLARELVQTGLAQLGEETMPSLSVICLDDDLSAALVATMQKYWQQSLSIFVNIQRLSAEEFAAAIAAGDYTLALYPIQTTQNAPDNTLGAFVQNNSRNVCAYTSTQFETLLSQALAAQDFDQMASLFAQAEQYLIDDAGVVPLYYEESYVFYHEDVQGAEISPYYGKLYFGNAYLD